MPNQQKVTRKLRAIFSADVKGYSVLMANDEVSTIQTLQDEITVKLMEIMQIKLTFGEQARLWEGGTTNIQAYDRQMRGNDCFFRNNEKDNKQAQLYYKEAINIDKAYAMPYIMLGYSHILDLIFRWSKSPIKSL